MKNSNGESVLIGETLLGKLSPLQRKILLELALGPLTLEAISGRTGSSIYTVGKQLSLLQMRTSYNPLKAKGISRPLVKKEKEFGVRTTYFLV